MAMDDEVKLLGSWSSPYVMRPRIALNLKSIPYVFLPETFGSKSDLLLTSNPVYKKIPVLIHNGRAISESMIIVNYIDDAWPSSGVSLLPSDPYDRAVARFWAFFADDKWSPALRALMMASTEEAKAETAEQVEQTTKMLEEAFEKCGKGKGFFGGDEIGYLDIAIGSILGWVRAVGRMSGVGLLDGGKTPMLAGWAERFCGHAAVKDLMPETEKLVEFGKMLQASVRGA